MSESSSGLPGHPAEARPPGHGDLKVDARPDAPSGTGSADRRPTGPDRAQFCALVAGAAVFAIAVAMIPAFDGSLMEGDGWSYETLVDDRGRFVIATLLAPIALLALAAGVPLLRRYGPSRGRSLVTVGLSLFAAGTALFALALAGQMPLAVAARSELDPVVGETFVEFAQDVDEAWELEPWFIGGFFLSTIGWIVFVIGARRARTITTSWLVGLLLVGSAWNFLPPSWALTLASVAMTAALAWLGWRVLQGPAPTTITRAPSPAQRDN